MRNSLEISPEQQFVREAKIGFSVLLLMGVVFFYFGYVRVQSYRARIPDHVLNAPAAVQVGPDHYSTQLKRHSKSAQKDQEDEARNVAPKSTWQNTSAQTPGTASDDGFEKDEPNFERLTPPPGTGSEKFQNQPPEKTTRRLRQPDPIVSSDPTKNQGRIPASLLTSGSDNRQTAFDIARRPFKPTPLRTASSSGRQDSDDETRPKASRQLPQPKVEKAATPITSLFEKGRQFFPAKLPSIKKSGNANEFQPDSPPKKEPVIESKKGPASKPDSKDLKPQSEPPKKSPNKSSSPASVVKASANLADNEFQVRSDSSVSNQGGKTPTPAGRTSEQTGEMRSHQTQKGETYWSIASNYYDDGRLFRALFEHNRPRVLPLAELESGITLDVPPLEVLLKQYPAQCPPDLLKSKSKSKSKPARNIGNVHLTQNGETLFSIAQQHYGQAARYLDILHANSSSLPASVNHLSELPAGIKLQLPD